MKHSTHIVITGFMASGKTSVARALAPLINTSAIDLDEVISLRARSSIPHIIKYHGEAYFRALETEMLRTVLESPKPKVVSLGGRTWIEEQNRKLIVAGKPYGCPTCFLSCSHRRISLGRTTRQAEACRTLTVWLDGPFDLCWQRILLANSDQRPLARNYHQTLDLYVERSRVYGQADIRLAADGKQTPAELAADLFTRPRSGWNG